MGCRMRCAHIPVLFLAPLKGEPARAERSASRVRHIGLCLIGCRPLATRLVPLQLRAYIVRDPSVSHFVPDSSPFRGAKVSVALRAFFMPAEPARRFAPIKTGIVAKRHLSPISEAASVPYKNPSPQATPLKAVSCQPSVVSRRRGLQPSAPISHFPFPVKQHRFPLHFALCTLHSTLSPFPN